MEKDVSRPIKIDSNLFTVLELWLKSKDARDMGYHSKSAFATEAVRDLLEQHMGTKPKLSDLITLLNEQKELIKVLKSTSLQVEKHMEHVKKLEGFWFKTNFPDLESH